MLNNKLIFVEEGTFDNVDKLELNGLCKMIERKDGKFKLSNKCNDIFRLEENVKQLEKENDILLWVSVILGILLVLCITSKPND